uniref:Uncharacterized protein n=1 Tax=Pseudoalteromonas citrea DSM 8771 TaxID=1117314 RepID=U1JRN8_9GAMM
MIRFLLKIYFGEIFSHLFPQNDFTNNKLANDFMLKHRFKKDSKAITLIINGFDTELLTNVVGMKSCINIMQHCNTVYLALRNHLKSPQHRATTVLACIRSLEAI